jgi:membrane dipeptidase
VRIFDSHHAFAYASVYAAAASAAGQFAYYRELEQAGELRIVVSAEELQAAAAAGTAPASRAASAAAGPVSPPGCREGHAPITVILALEGADPIVSPDRAGEWADAGLRVASLVHYGRGRYAGGTGTEAGLTDAGGILLGAFEENGIILDVTHLSERAFFEALSTYYGPLLASHNNCRALVPGDRQFSDDQIRLIAEREGVIGVAADAWMLSPGWIRGKSERNAVGIEALADHIEHICRITGSTDYAGIGSDLDGGYGREQTPRGLDTIADLSKLEIILKVRGFSREEREKIRYGNMERFFLNHLT